jgi:hypothetical protein
MRDLPSIPHEPQMTDADVARHRIIIARRQAAEDAARAENHRMEHPRNRSEWTGEPDESPSPPIVKREEKHSIPFTHNRGLGVPSKDED